MKTVILQQDITWADCDENIRMADAAIDSSPGADLYILPEMFSTGFCTEPETLPDDIGEKTLRWMKEKAVQTGAAIAGSSVVKENGRYFNRFFFVMPDGTTDFYDKKHLFTYGGEHEHFTAGSDRTVVEFKGVRILLEICYDLRFPVWSRNHGDYDMIIYVASWPSSRRHAWDSLLVARAIENQCYVAGVNRTGADPYNEYSGGSVVINPYGATIAKCEDGRVSAAESEIDIVKLEAFRKKFPVLNDSDVL